MPQLSKKNFAKSVAKVRRLNKGPISSITPALTEENIKKVLGVSKKPDSSNVASSRNKSIISSQSKNKAVKKVVSIQLSFEEPNSESQYSDISYRMNEPAIKDAYRKFVMNLSQSTVNETICSTPLLERRSESVDIFSSSQTAVEKATKVQSQDEKDKASIDSGLPLSQVSSNEMRESFSDLMNEKLKDQDEFNFMKNFKEPAKRKAGKSSLHKLKGMEEKPTKTKSKQIIEPTEKSVFKKKGGSKTMNEEPRTKNNKVLQQNNKNALKATDVAEKMSFYDQMLLIQESRNVGLYCLCDNCDKARYLPDIKDPLDLPEKWYCSMNPDPNHNSCDDPEEVPVDEDFLIENLYNAGSIVWAKMDGYPWWPAMVEDDPDTEDYFYLEKNHDVKPTYYHVTFFDSYEVTRAWIRPKFLKPFKINMTNPEFQIPKFNKFRSRIEFGFKQAEEAVNLSLIDRLRKYSFIQRYAKPLKRNKAEEGKPMKRSLNLKKRKSEKINPAKKKRTGFKKIYSSDDDGLNKNQDSERISAAKKKPVFRKIISSDNDENSNISVILKNMDWDNENINLNIIEKFV